MSWKGSLDEWNIKNVDLTDTKLSNFCKPRILQDYLIWAEPVSYQKMVDNCRRFGGFLPSVNENNPLEEVHDAGKN